MNKSTAEMSKETTYERPSENFITIGAERFRCAEVLLLPYVIGTVCTLSLPPQRGRLGSDVDTQLKSTAKIDTGTSTLSVLNGSVASKFVLAVSQKPRIHDTSLQNNMKYDVSTSEKNCTPCHAVIWHDLVPRGF